MNLNTHEKIINVSTKWFYKVPYLSEFLLRCSYTESDKVPTMGVGLSKKNNIAIYYNKDYVEEISQEEVEGVLLHEILHIISLTHSRQQNRNHKIWNIATDIVNNEEIINEYTIEGMKIILPEDRCKFEDVKKEGYNGTLIADDIYDFIFDKNNDNFMNTIDIHDMIEDMTDEEKQNISIKAQDIIDSAKSKNYGSMSANLINKIKQLTAPQKIPIRKILRNAIHKQVYGSFNCSDTYNKRNRRGNELLPGKKWHSNKFNLVVDTSGSCFDESIVTSFFSEIDYIAQNFQNLQVIQFDTKVQSISTYKKNDWKNFKLNGGGGTDIQPVFEYLKEKGKLTEPLIIFTDGFFNLEFNNYGIKPLWVLTEDTPITFGTKLILKNEK